MDMNSNKNVMYGYVIVSLVVIAVLSYFVYKHQTKANKCKDVVKSVVRQVATGNVSAHTIKKAAVHAGLNPRHTLASALNAHPAAAHTHPAAAHTHPAASHQYSIDGINTGADYMSYD
jgi:hypothetical protein